MTEFKVGDKVRVCGSFDGEITYGPFKSAFERYTMYVVRNETGNERAQHDTDLTALPKFAIGDRVEKPATGVRPGTIVAGPFVTEYDDVPFWVVEHDNGKVSTPREDGDLKRIEEEPAREIKVGDRVKVVSGRGISAYIGKTVTLTKVGASSPYGPYGFKGGFGGEIYAEEVELIREAPADTFEYNGVTYDLTATYRDKDGDEWTFKGGTRASDGTPDGAMNGYAGGTYSYTLGYAARHYAPLTRI
ncbi:phiSA1p31-related protein [Streptomyces sp. R44]|uniref:PhiSA1p31-related protein n=1 Tax=Streptomyces sp. R44 TaxID=3238633 RepID=A0AB39T519_9ACTN